MIQYKIEDVIEGKEALQEIGQKCWDEVDQLNQTFLFDPDWEKYQQANDQGMIRYYTAYDGDTLIGFSLFIITPMLHCKGKFSAVSDCVYLEPEYRRKHFTDFTLLIQDDLKLEGVQLFTLHVKAWLDTGNLSERIGCTHQENVLQRSL